MNDNQTQENNLERRYYEEYVNEANNRIKSNQEAQDKMILAISAAFFGIMPFLLEKLQVTCLTKILVVFLLAFNTLALLCVLLSYLLCKKGNEEDIEFAEKYYLKNDESSFNKKSCYTKCGILCNFLSCIFTFLTLLFLAIILGIYFFNKEYIINNDSNKNQSVKIQNGFTSAEMKKIPQQNPQPNIQQNTQNNNNVNSGNNKKS